MSRQLREFQSHKSTLVKEAQALTDRVAADNRGISDEKVAAFDALRTRNRRCIGRDQSQGCIDRRRSAHWHHHAIGPKVTDNRDGGPKRCFYSIGESVQAEDQTDKLGQSIDSCLLPGGISVAAPTTFSNEAVGQGDEFLLPPQFSQEILKLSHGEDTLLPLTDNVEISGNCKAVPQDKTKPWGTNGIPANWQGGWRQLS
ncbi:MAG: hypothetical protein H7274_10655 [Rhodoferax sp.]|nr:hypothetical protein [Rhodoferax sp.]